MRHPTRATTATGARRRLAARLRAQRPPDDATALALAALRPAPRRRDGAGWMVGIDGESGRALLQPAGTWYAVPVRPTGPMHLRARVKLLAHDWRDGRGQVAASLWALDADGRRRRLWRRILATDAAHGRPRGARLSCELPPSTVAVTLGVQRIGRVRPRSVGRAIWLEPMLSNAIPPTAESVGDEPAAGATRAGREARDGGGPRAQPTISVLMPVHDPPPEMLRQAVESVLGQSYDDWELCITDDGSSDPEVRAMLAVHADADPRVHVHRRDPAGGISAATNAALALAAGDYVALLDHDDALTPDALRTVADRLTADPTLDMLYSDEDVVSADGKRLQWHQKPGWSPEQFETAMYTCHLGVYRRRLVEEIGGLDSRFDGCQDYDLVLRLMERGARVGHIPEVLYHWRAHAASTASGEEAKPYAYLAQPTTISAYLHRRGTDAEVQFGKHPGMHRIVHRLDPSRTVAIAMATPDEGGLTQAALSLASQSPAGASVVVAAPPERTAAVADALLAAGITMDRMTVVGADPVGDPAGALDAAARRAEAHQIVLMTHPVHGLTHEWITRLAGYVDRPDIGAAGPIVLSPTGTIAHAGIAIPQGIPLWIHHESAPDAAPPIATNVAALSGVIVTSRDAFARAGGLDAGLGELALIDLCLRLGSSGLRSVLVPDARVQQVSPERPVNDLRQFGELRRRWSDTMGVDPYYSPWNRTDRADFSRLPHPA